MSGQQASLFAFSCRLRGYLLHPIGLGIMQLRSASRTSRLELCSTTSYRPSSKPSSGRLRLQPVRCSGAAQAYTRAEVELTSPGRCQQRAASCLTLYTPQSLALQRMDKAPGLLCSRGRWW